MAGCVEKQSGIVLGKGWWDGRDSAFCQVVLRVAA